MGGHTHKWCCQAKAEMSSQMVCVMREAPAREAAVKLYHFQPHDPYRFSSLKNLIVHTKGTNSGSSLHLPGRSNKSYFRMASE